MDLENWQSYTAPLIVLITVAVFIRRWMKARDVDSCGQSCGCSASKQKKKVESVTRRPS